MYCLQKMAGLGLSFIRRQRLYFSLRKILGFWPRHIAYYELALRHKSLSLHKADGSLQNNERLEFLGDSILDALVADALYRHFPNEEEGFLTTTRSKIVKRDSLNHLSVSLGLDHMTMMANHTNSLRSDVYGNTLEALFGAIYLDRGFGYCRRFLERKILGTLLDIDEVAKSVCNYKSLVLEWCQQRRYELNFSTMEAHLPSDGDSHTPSFDCEVLIQGRSVACSQGYSKKNAQQKASKMVWAKIQAGELE